MQYVDFDQLIPQDHRARTIWEYVGGLDLSPLLDEIGSVDGSPGRPAIDPAVLLSVWLLAISESVGSARRLADLCRWHHAYMWLCGGVSVEYRTLSSFRIKHEEALEALMAKSLAGLITAGVLSVDRIAQDGMRVRASAGASSFRRKKRLKELEEKALEHVRALREELESDPGAESRRQAAARERAARERAQRVEAALKAVDELAEQDERAAPKAGKRGRGDDDEPGGAPGPLKERKRERRASTTDAEARIMRFPNGGCAPGFNVQFATDVATGLIVGVDVTNSGSDYNQLAPMLQRVEELTGIKPKEALVDTGFAGKKDIAAAAQLGCTVYSNPVRRAEAKRVRPKREPPEIEEWRQRMATDEARAIYKLRAPAAERPNAEARNRGLRALSVRGVRKARCVCLLFAIMQNMMRTWSILPNLRAAGLPA
jgi:transposase